MGMQWRWHSSLWDFGSALTVVQKRVITSPLMLPCFTALCYTYAIVLIPASLHICTRSPYLHISKLQDGVFNTMYSGDRAPYSPVDFLFGWWNVADHLAEYQQQVRIVNSLLQLQGTHCTDRCLAAVSSSNFQQRPLHG